MAFLWVSTVLQIKDPLVSVPFYENNFGMKLIHKAVEESSTEYTLVIPPSDTATECDVPHHLSKREELFNFLRESKSTCLTLLHVHGSEKDEEFVIHSGNEEPHRSYGHIAQSRTEPHRSYGHIAFNCDDVYSSYETLKANGVSFKKGPDDGRMKGLAFCYDPNGYWIEIIHRSEEVRKTFRSPYNLSQTNFRVKDPKASVAFYQEKFGMSLVDTGSNFKFDDFTLYFLKIEKDDTPLFSRWHPVLELTHNHGTEEDSEIKGMNSCEPPAGFKSLRFLALKESGVTESVKLRDPDNYLIEIVVP